MRFFDQAVQTPEAPSSQESESAAFPPNASYTYVNEAGVSEEDAQEVWRKGTTLDGRPVRDEIASAMTQWMNGLNSSSLSGGSLFFRNRYQMSTNIYDQMASTSDAVHYDEVLGSVCDATEEMAFQKVTMEMVDQDQEDCWNQVAKKINLKTVLRQSWREIFKFSQVYIGVEWEQQVLKVRTPGVPLTGDDEPPPDATAVPPQVPQPPPQPLPQVPPPASGLKKRQRRKQFAVDVPSNLTIFDCAKVLPVGQLMFGKERFVYIASLAEHQAFQEVFEGRGADPTVLRMFDGPYEPTLKEREALSEAHRGPINKVFLWLFKRDACFRHTLSRAHYERFAAVRLVSALPVLEMKAHLRASDRSALIGSTNFIIVLKRGSDKFPARPGEVEQLREQSRTVARMPILVGDHRLSVEIITPKTDFVLDEKRYDLLDARLIMRGLGSFKLPSSKGKPAGEGAGSSGDEEVARGIESRRNDLAETFERELFEVAVRRNEGVFTECPQISFHPKRVVLNLDPALMGLVLKLRDRGDISRETELEEFQLDQEIEWVRRKREKGLDSVFKSSVPFSSPATNPFTSGSAGGRPSGGGGSGADSTPAAGKDAPVEPQA